MTESQGNLAGGLFFRAWLPDSSKGIVLLAHGLAEHVGRYEYVATKLNDAGYAVFGPDHYGHGQSPGERCYVDRFDDFLDGMDEMYLEARRQLPDVPVSMLGHSMGGLIAASTALREPERYRALMLSGPAVVPPQQPPAIQRMIVRLLSKISPKQRVLALDGSAISREQAVIDAYNADPLVFNGKITARLVSELFDAMHLLQDRAGDLTMPLLLMHGSADRLTAPAGSVLLHDRTTSTEKTLKIYDDLYHEIFNESERDRVIADMVSWLDSQHVTP